MSERGLGREAISDGSTWAFCWICDNVFRRKRETKRYCIDCNDGFCEGEHGTFAQKRGPVNVGRCILCIGKQS